MAFTIDRSSSAEGAGLRRGRVAIVLCGSEVHLHVVRSGGRLGCGGYNSKTCERTSVSGGRGELM